MLNKVGICFGGYCPMHRGHLDVIMKAKKQCDKVFVVVCGYDNEPRANEIKLDLNKRYALVTEFFKSDEQITVLKVNDTKLGIDESMSLHNWNVWTKEVKHQIEIILKAERFQLCWGNYHFYVAEQRYVDDLTAIDEPSIYIQRVNPISGTAIRKEPMKWFPQIVRTFQPYFVKNILVIGTASEGKTTLVNDIAKYFNIPKTVEYGRVYMEQRNITDVDLVANDFHQFISGQYEEYKKAVMNAQKGITIQDTDNLVTLMYAKAYVYDPDIDISMDDYQALTLHARSVAKYFCWDHIFVVRPGNPNFVDDGSRYMKQASMSERKENMARLEKLIRNFDYPSGRITYLTGGEFEKNFEIVRDYIQNLK